MVDIVQSNETKLLIRKIGYSVGLESTLERFALLIEVYVRDRQLSDPSWQKLVKEGFGRDPQTRKHFESFFSVLGIFSVENGRPVSHSVLDSGALLRHYFEDDEVSYKSALRALLLYALTLADGELFGSLISTNFDRDSYESALTSFRQEKLRIFYESYKNKFDREKLHQIIDFQEVSGTTEKKALGGALRGPFAGMRDVSNRDIEDCRVTLSGDWYKKVPGRRQAWAEDIGLFSKGKQTDQGQRYIAALTSLLDPTLRQLPDPIILMPLATEMLARNVTWQLPDEIAISHSAFLEAISSTFLSNDDLRTRKKKLDLDHLARKFFDQFSKADTRFQMLRKELPYLVFAQVVLGICAANRWPIGKLQVELEDLAKEDRSILLRTSRPSVFGISFSKS